MLFKQLILDFGFDTPCGWYHHVASDIDPYPWSSAAEEKRLWWIYRPPYIQFVHNTRITQAISNLRVLQEIQIERVDGQHNGCLGYAFCSFTPGCKMLDLEEKFS